MSSRNDRVRERGALLAFYFSSFELTLFTLS
jgi:hypothetical protein